MLPKKYNRGPPKSCVGWQSTLMVDIYTDFMTTYKNHKIQRKHPLKIVPSMMFNPFEIDDTSFPNTTLTEGQDIGERSPFTSLSSKPKT